MFFAMAFHIQLFINGIVIGLQETFINRHDFSTTITLTILTVTTTF